VVTPDQLGSLEPWVLLDLLVNRVLLAIQEPQVPRVRSDSRVPPAAPALQAARDRAETKVSSVLRDLLVRRDRLDSRELQVPRDRGVTRDNRDNRVSLDCRATPDRLETLDPRDQLDHPE
jgi:hypothetical protein